MRGTVDTCNTRQRFVPERDKMATVCYCQDEMRIAFTIQLVPCLTAPAKRGTASFQKCPTVSVRCRFYDVTTTDSVSVLAWDIGND